MIEHRDWRGSGDALAATVTELLDQLGLGRQQIGERLVRYYVQQGVLSRPEREGREAVYTYRQLLELVVARLMAEDGWPLAKIADFNRSADEKALLDLIPNRRGARPARETVGGAELAVHLQENLAREGRLPPLRVSDKVELSVDGCFSVLFDAEDFRNVNAAKIDHYSKLFRETLEFAVQRARKP